MLGIDSPKVAILSAVETVNPKIESTLDAAALCKMAERGQITGGILDGPLAFDNAISEQAAQTKKITSRRRRHGRHPARARPRGGQHAGQAALLPGRAEGAGIVLGARVPIVLTSRADSVRTRLASTAVMALVAHARRTGKLPIEVTAMSDVILVLNAGSSSLKFSVFFDREPPAPVIRGQLEGLFTQPRFRGPRPNRKHQSPSKNGPAVRGSGHDGAIDFLFGWGRSGVLSGHRFVAAGHRVGHGGLTFTAAGAGRGRRR